jgi:dTDP-4-dehydrorhamnose reductase
VAVLGGSGLVGSRVLELWSGAVELHAPTHARLDVLDAEALEAFLRQTHAPVVLNLAAWADVDGAEVERADPHGRVFGLNAAYPERLAELCARLDKYLVHVSTDYVFGGTRAERPYVENDETDPRCWYAETKLIGEQRVLASGARACVARIEMPFTGRDHRKRDFARTCLNRLKAGQTIVGVVDQHVTPIFLDDAVEGLRRLIEARFTGVVHVAAADWTTPYRFAHSIARRLGFDTGLVIAEEFEVFAATRPARRPQHPWLDVSLFNEVCGQHVLRPVEAELDSWVDQLLSAPSRV